MMERVISTGSLSKGSIASVSIVAAVSEGCMCQVKIQKESMGSNRCEAYLSLSYLSVTHLEMSSTEEVMIKLRAERT